MLNLKKWLSPAGLVAGVFLAFFAAANVMAATGPEYKALASPQPVDTGAKIEVIEFFWYGCPHCYHLEPDLEKWVAKLPKDVEFRRVSATFLSTWAPLTQLYYTLEALGEVGRLHRQVFDAIHADHVNFNDESIRLEWMAKKGIDRKKFNDAWNSFSVQSDVKRSARISQLYELDGVPTLIVDGKYMTSPAMTNGFDKCFKVLDELIVRARGERKKK